MKKSAMNKKPNKNRQGNKNIQNSFKHKYKKKFLLLKE